MRTSVTLLLLALAAAPTLAQDDPPRDCGRGGQEQYTQSSENGRRTRIAARWGRSGCTTEIEAEGDFTLRTDLTDVERVSRDGYVEITERRGGTRRRVEITAGADGRIVHRYSVNRDSAAWDGDAQRWLAGVLLELERRTAFAADTRVPALRERGGSAAVLEEITRLRADHAKRRYYTVLLAADSSIDDAALGRVMEHAGRELDSDYELAELLVQVAKGGRVRDRAAQSAFVRATATIGSDYEHRRALSALLADSDADAALRPDVAAAIFVAAKDIGSDYEAAELLIGAARRGLVKDAASAPFFAAVDGIGSAYERRRTLSALLQADSLADELVVGVLKSSGGISSDYERAELLVTLARTRPRLTGSLREAYLDAADRISSDHERNRAVAALGRKRM